MDDIVLREDIPYLFMPTIAGTVLKGDIFHTSVSYLDEKTVLDFNFDRAGSIAESCTYGKHCGKAS